MLNSRSVLNTSRHVYNIQKSRQKTHPYVTPAPNAYISPRWATRPGITSSRELAPSARARCLVDPSARARSSSVLIHPSPLSVSHLKLPLPPGNLPYAIESQHRMALAQRRRCWPSLPLGVGVGGWCGRSGGRITPDGLQPSLQAPGEGSTAGRGWNRYTTKIPVLQLASVSYK